MNPYSLLDLEVLADRDEELRALFEPDEETEPTLEPDDLPF